MGQLRQAGPCGSDGFDQFFGIPRGVAKPWAVKQGWSGYGSIPPVRCKGNGSATPSALLPPSTRPPAPVDFRNAVLHTTGVVGQDDRYIEVVLTTQTSRWSDSVTKITRLARDVHQAAPRPMRLGRRVAEAAEIALATRKYVTVVDVLTGLRWVHTRHVESWRQGRAGSLEELAAVDAARDDRRGGAAGRMGGRPGPDRRGDRPSSPAAATGRRCASPATGPRSRSAPSAASGSAPRCPTRAAAA